MVDTGYIVAGVYQPTSSGGTTLWIFTMFHGINSKILQTLCGNIGSCSHASRESVLHLGKKLSCHKKMAFTPNKQLSLLTCICLFVLFFCFINIYIFISYLMLYTPIYRYKFNMTCTVINILKSYYKNTYTTHNNMIYI